MRFSVCVGLLSNRSATHCATAWQRSKEGYFALPTKHRLAAGLAIACLGLALSCSRADQERAKEKAAEARHKVREDAAQLQRDVHFSTEHASAKLDRAAMLAKIKTKLAADVGPSTLVTVDADSAGHVVTLRGTVHSDEQRREAAEAVAQIEGVTQVVNHLRVEP